MHVAVPQEGGKMSDTNISSSSSGGIGFVGALTILFVALKLLKVIAWSWLWVLSPLWIAAAFLVVFAVVTFLVIVLTK